jgi:hypothetical protein
MPHVTKNREQQAAVPVIHCNAVYSLDLARNALGLAKATLGREIRLGRLRVAKRAGKYMILGSWLLEWIESGEVSNRKGTAAQVIATGSQAAENEKQQDLA